MRSDGLAAYMVGAGVAGTLVILPYCGSALFRTHFPPVKNLYVPFFLLPVIWGFWNMIYVRLKKISSIGAWGVILGIGISLVLNAYLYISKQWFQEAFILLVYIPAVYYLLWHIIIGPINKALGIQQELG
jgi:hypothetical protein